MATAQVPDSGLAVLSIDVHAGISLPVGRFGAYPLSSTITQGATNMLGAGATIGPIGAVSAHYAIGSRIGLVVMAEGSWHDRLNKKYAGTPLSCSLCATGQHVSRLTMWDLDVGEWRSTSIWFGPTYEFIRGETSLQLRAGVGYQHWHSDAIHYQEIGDQWESGGPSQPPSTPYGFSLVQPVSTGTGLVRNVGLVVRHRLFGRLTFSGSADIAWGQVVFKGEQLLQYDGITELQTQAITTSTVPFEERSSVTRLSFRAGLGFDVRRRRS
jgi:hypothetical protein